MSKSNTKLKESLLSREEKKALYNEKILSIQAFPSDLEWIKNLARSLGIAPSTLARVMLQEARRVIEKKVEKIAPEKVYLDLISRASIKE